MNYLSEVSQRAQDWQQRLEVVLREVREVRSEPKQPLRDVLPGVMAKLDGLEAKASAVLQSAKDVETAARTAAQGATGT